MSVVMNSDNKPSATARDALALQVKHNLQYQQNWSSIVLHKESPLAPGKPLPYLLFSGIPPARLYVHPDQQAAEIREQKERSRKTSFHATSATGQPGSSDSGATSPRIEREWVLPAHLREKWSLRQLAGVFDAIGAKPALIDGEASSRTTSPSDASTESNEADAESRADLQESNAKRILLAIVNDDSTINYYIMHDGIVKPRQN